MDSANNTNLTVFQKQLQMVYRIAYTYLCSRKDAENAAQEVFVRLFRSDVRLNDTLAVKAWLVSKVTSICLKRINDPAFTVRDDPDGHEIDETMAAIMSLPGKYKTVAYLFYYEELTAAQTAELMGDDLEVTRSIIGKLHRTMTAKLGEDSGDYESAYDRIRIDANSAVKIWKNILEIQDAIDAMLKKQGGAEKASVDDEPAAEEPKQEIPAVPEREEPAAEPEHLKPIIVARESLDDEDEEELRIFTPKAEKASEPAPEEEPEEEEKEEFEFINGDVGLGVELHTEELDWDTEEEDGDAPEYAEPESQTDAEPEPQRRAAQHTKHSGHAAKRKSVLVPVLIGAAVIIAAACLLMLLFKDTPKKSESKPSQSGSSGVSSALSVPVATQAPTQYQGSGSGVKKVKAVQNALDEWKAYKAEQTKAYFDEHMPSFTEFALNDSFFDGTEIVENGDGTFSFIHWVYDEDWGNTSVSQITGAEEPTLIQRFDYENSVTVEENEYNSYMAYIASADEMYGDYNYSYGVKNEADAAKLEEIASKAKLALRRGYGESKGYGEIGDGELANELTGRSCKGSVYNETPEFDYINFYDGGAFESMAEIRLKDGRRMYSLLCAAPYTEMIDAAAAGGITRVSDKMSERSYKAADGTKLTIVQNEEQAIVYAYLDDWYAVLDLSINAWRETPAIDDSEEARAAKRETDMKLSDEVVNFVCDGIRFSNIGK